MFCPAPSEVNYPSVIISIDEDIVRLRITLYYLNIVEFLDDVFDLACPYLPPRECDGVDVNQFCGCGMAFQAMRMGNKIVFNWKFQDTLSFLQSELGFRPPRASDAKSRRTASSVVLS